MRTSNEIPGLRTPTADEKDWINSQWGADLDRLYVPRTGKILRYLGIFFIGFAVASSVRGIAGLTETVVLATAAAACMGFYCLNRYSDKVYKNRIIAVKSGNYQVAPAVAVKVTGGGDGAPGGIIKAILPDGTPLNGGYAIPSVCAQELLRKKIQQFPVLLIKISNDRELLAIPVQR